jgi:hypothetical protein
VRSLASAVPFCLTADGRRDSWTLAPAAHARRAAARPRVVTGDDDRGRSVAACGRARAAAGPEPHSQGVRKRDDNAACGGCLAWPISDPLQVEGLPAQASAPVQIRASSPLRGSTARLSTRRSAERRGSRTQGTSRGQVASGLACALSSVLAGRVGEKSRFKFRNADGEREKFVSCGHAPPPRGNRTGSLS